LIGEESPDERSEPTRQRECTREVPGVAAALSRRDDVADDGEGERRDPARAETLQPAERDQLAEVLGDATQHRRDEEQRNGGLVDALAAVEVGDLAVERHACRRAEQVRGDDPREMFEPTEVTDHGGARSTRVSDSRAEISSPVLSPTMTMVRSRCDSSCSSP
jgi:hypothetical protein